MIRWLCVTILNFSLSFLIIFSIFRIQNLVKLHGFLHAKFMGYNVSWLCDVAEKTHTNF